MASHEYMTHTRQSESWDLGARSLHWLMAVLLLLQSIVGWIGHEMDRSPLKVDVMTAHKSLGITLLLLVAIRLLWRWTHPAPAPPPGTKPWEARAARLSHAALYLLMIALPLSGWLSASTSLVPWKLWWFIPWPAIAPVDPHLHEIATELHEALVWSLAALLAIHIAAALRHHFVKRDTVLLRMSRGQP
jgi:cytochrome b561